MANNSFTKDEGLLVYVAQTLSAMTIVSCVFLKVPQIMYVHKKKSADGMYVQGMLMEVVGFSITTMYNIANGYSIVTYIEYPIILVQMYVLLYLVARHSNTLNLTLFPMFVSSYVVIMGLFASGWLPEEILSNLVPWCTPLGSFAKLSYVFAMINAGNANTVSLTTWVISVATNLARVFTVSMDSGDKKLIANFFISAVLSSAVLITAAYYKLNPRPPLVPSPPQTPPPPLRRLIRQRARRDSGQD